MKPLDKEHLTNIPIVDMGDLLLRPVRYEDYKDMYDYGSDTEVTRHLAWNAYQAIDEAKRSVELVFLKRPENDIPSAYAIFHKSDHKMIGTCDFFKMEWEKERGEIGYVLHRNYWGRGYMTRVLGELIQFGFVYLQLRTIDIRHHPDNIGSRRVIEKCGFRYVGDQYYPRFEQDIPSYELTKEEYEGRKSKKI